MSNGPEALSEREKETLRLLLAGHDAKSTASHLGLSVHTVNERLRDARRKLGVSSSREAARLLFQAEQRTPNSLADKSFGVVRKALDVSTNGRPDGRPGAGRALAWFTGGMLIMSLIVAAFVLSSALPRSGAQKPETAKLQSAAASPSASQSAGVKSAREWVALVDGQRWEDSWRSAGTLFKSQVSAQQWASAVQPVRQPLGVVSKRALQSVTTSNSLPGAPAGEYQIVLFQTSFAHKSGATEQVVLARGTSGWKVIGYFIR